MKSILCGIEIKTCAKGLVSKSRQLEERGLVLGHVFEGYFNKAGFDSALSPSRALVI